MELRARDSARGRAALRKVLGSCRTLRWINAYYGGTVLLLMGLAQYISRLVLGIDMAFLLLLGFSFLYIEPGSGPYVVALLTLVPIVLTLVMSVVVLYTGWEPFE